MSHFNYWDELQKTSKCRWFVREIEKKSQPIKVNEIVSLEFDHPNCFFSSFHLIALDETLILRFHGISKKINYYLLVIIAKINFMNIFFFWAIIVAPVQTELSEWSVRTMCVHKCNECCVEVYNGWMNVLWEMFIILLVLFLVCISLVSMFITRLHCFDSPSDFYTTLIWLFSICLHFALVFQIFEKNSSVYTPFFVNEWD